MALSSRKLLPVKRRLLLGSPGAVSRRLVTEHATRGRVQVEHQREDGLARHVKKLDLAPAEVLPGCERVDLVGPEVPLRGGRAVVRVLDVDFSPRLAGEDVRLAAAEPDVSPGARRFRRDFIVLAAKRIQSFEGLEFFTLNR